MQEDAEKVPEEPSAYDEEVKGDIEDDVHGFGEDEDVRTAEDDAYLNAFSNVRDDLARFLIGDEWGNEDDDDDDYISPIDDIDTLEFYTGALKSAFEREPVIQSALTPEVLRSFQRLAIAATAEKQDNSGMR